MTRNPQPPLLQSVARAFEVLEAIGRAGRPLSLAEIAEAADIDKSAAQRAAQTLTQLGYLERGRDGRGLAPGRRLLDRSFDYLRMNPLIELATPVLIELRRTARERVDLSLFDGPSIIYAVRLQSKRETFFATLVGRRVPTFSSSGGRAMLALMSDAEVDAVLAASDLRKVTPKTICDREGVMAKLAEARRDGFALALEENLIGEVAVAAAIAAPSGAPLGAIHVAGSLSEWTPEAFAARFGPLVVEAARALAGSAADPSR